MYAQGGRQRRGRAGLVPFGAAFGLPCLAFPSLCLSVCRGLLTGSVCLSVCLSVWLAACLPACLPVHADLLSHHH